MDPDERQRLEALAQAIVQKTGGSAALLEELGSYLSPPASGPEEASHGR